jgi:hypothetical protein
MEVVKVVPRAGLALVGKMGPMAAVALLTNPALLASQVVMGVVWVATHWVQLLEATGLFADVTPILLRAVEI